MFSDSFVFDGIKKKIKKYYKVLKSKENGWKTQVARTKHSDADGLRALQLRQKREAVNI